MNKSINLLGNIKKTSNVLRTRIKILRYIAISLLFLVSCASVLLFILIALSPLPALRQNEQTALAEIAQHHPKIAKYLFLQERLRSLQVMVKDRRTFSTAYSLAQAELPKGTEIIAAEMEGDTVSITVSAVSLAPMDTFINSLIRRTEEKKVIGTLRLNELGTDEQTGEFRLTVEMVLL